MASAEWQNKTYSYTTTYYSSALLVDMSSLSTIYWEIWIIGPMGKLVLDSRRVYSMKALQRHFIRN